MTSAARKRHLLPIGWVVLLAGLSGCTPANDDVGAASAPSVVASSEAAEAASEAAVAAQDLRTGECMTDTGTAATPNILVVPCAEPHAFEVFATTELPEGDYPGIGEADAQAQEFCRSQFSAFIGVEYDASVLELQYFYPVESGWTSVGGRSIVCLVGNAGGEPARGTLLDSAR